MPCVEFSTSVYRSMWYKIHAKILAYCPSDMFSTTILLNIAILADDSAIPLDTIVSTEERHPVAKAILESGPVTIVDSSFTGITGSPHLGICIWEGSIEYIDGMFEFDGKWYCPYEHKSAMRRLAPEIVQ